MPVYYDKFISGPDQTASVWRPEGEEKMLAYIIGIVSGAALPIQTGVNSKLSARARSQLFSGFVSFFGGTLVLGLFCLLAAGFAIPEGAVSGNPLWMWSGGLCGVVLILLNMVLFRRLGSVQTVIFCALGQIIMGLIIDNFGLFRSEQTDLTLMRAAGALLVVLGVAMVSWQGKDHSSTGDPNRPHGAMVWVYRAGGLTAGAACSIQVAVNAYLSAVLGSSVKASFYSFAGGAVAMIVIVAVFYAVKGKPEPDRSIPNSPWLYSGGVLGAICVAANIYLAVRLGTGMAVVISLVGQMLGGVIIDAAGLLGTDRKPVTVLKATGLVVMIAGTAMIRLI
jgi:transporter family-2 protein